MAQAGFADFDVPELDELLLRYGEARWTPYDVLRVAASQARPMDFAPGTRKEYSSTNFVLAGLVCCARLTRSISAHDLPRAHDLP